MRRLTGQGGIKLNIPPKGRAAGQVKRNAGSKPHAKMQWRRGKEYNVQRSNGEM